MLDYVHKKLSEAISNIDALLAVARLTLDIPLEPIRHVDPVSTFHVALEAVSDVNTFVVPRHHSPCVGIDWISEISNVFAMESETVRETGEAAMRVHDPAKKIRAVRRKCISRYVVCVVRGVQSLSSLDLNVEIGGTF